MQQRNGLVKAFNVAIFIRMYEVEGGRANEFMRFVTYLD
jgi:hypothetical protein